MRCAFCHEQLSSEQATVCPDCGTMVHSVCVGDLAGCPTLGCENAEFGTAPARVPEPREPGRLRRFCWLLFGVLAPGVAFAVDLYLRVDPLIWGRVYLWPDRGIEFAATVRLPLVWLAVLGSMAGMLLFLCGKLSKSLPLLALGVVVSAVHAVLFVPMLPISLFGSLMGIGLLGLCPYVTFLVYLDVFRRAQRRLARDEKHSGWASRLGLIKLGAACLVVLGLHWVSPASTRYATPAAPHLEGVDCARLLQDARELAADERTHGTWNETFSSAWAEALRVSEDLARVSKGAEVVHLEADYLRLDWRNRTREFSYPYVYSLVVLTGDQERPANVGTCYRHVEIAPGVWSQYYLKGEPFGGGPVFQELDPPGLW